VFRMPEAAHSHPAEAGAEAAHSHPAEAGAEAAHTRRPAEAEARNRHPEDPAAQAAEAGARSQAAGVPAVAHRAEAPPEPVVVVRMS